MPREGIGGRQRMVRQRGEENRMRGLKGKVAVVTGGGSGIGRAVAERLAEEGCRVAALDWNQDNVEEAVAGMVAAGGEAIALKADVGDEAAVAAAFGTIVERFGAVDVVCSNAGIFTAERDAIAAIKRADL